jgi:hypothetical protein
MALTLKSTLAIVLMRDDHFSGRNDGAEMILLLVGLAFAGLLVWAIQRTGRSTT